MSNSKKTTDNPTLLDFIADYNKWFKKKSDLEIIEAFNGQVGNGGWGTARQAYLWAIREELVKRNIDFSEVGDDSHMSYANKVELVTEKKVKISKI